MAIPNSATDTKVTSTLTGERRRFTIHEHAHEKMMGVLTNLYEDPEGAVIREYLTNALDAQKEKQAADPTWQWRPIEVTTPSHFAKTYTIRDFGVGMNVVDIENVYSQYGYSTKEHTNDQTGMLGLGSKCGLTYTGQFTVTGFKNGIKTIALITLNEDEVPEYVIIDTSTTTEPDGLQISIPVKDRNTFAEKTANFLRWWKDGEVLVDGKEPVKHGLKEVKPGVFLMERPASSWRYEVPQSFVIMGNVPYAVDPEHVDKSLRDAYMGFAAYVPMGAVDFPPNRERLRYNSRTKAAVASISTGLFETILAEKLKEITDAPDFKTAWRAWTALDHHFSSHAKAKGLKYKGHDFNERVAHAHMVLDWDWQGHGQIAERQWVNVGHAMQGVLVVTGVTQGTKPTSYFKKKTKFYMEQNNIDGSSALLVDDDIDNVWLDHLPRIDAETIKALKLPKDPSGPAGPRQEAPYDYYTVDAGGHAQFNSDVTITVPAGKTLVYISPQDCKETYRKQGCNPSDLAKRLGEDYILVVTGKNRFEKFLRSHKAIKASEAVQKRIDDYVATATNAEYLIGKLEYGEKEFLKGVDASKIDDPDLRDLAKTVQDKSFTANYAKAEELASFARRASIHPTLPEKKNVKGNVANRYPLINHVGGRQRAHLVIYINAVYAAEFAPKQP